MVEQLSLACNQVSLMDLEGASQMRKSRRYTCVINKQQEAQTEHGVIKSYHYVL